MYKLEKINECLNGLDIPDIKLANQQTRLKSSLLASKYFNLNNKFNFIFMIKQTKFYIPAALILIMAAAFIFGLVPGVNKVDIAQAKEMISESKFAISKLSTEARAQLEEIIKADLSKTLEDAYNANDLEYVGEDDLTMRDPSENLQVEFLDQETGVASQNGEIKTVTSVSVTGDDDGEIENSNTKIVFGKFIADYNDRMMTKIKVLKYTDKDGNKIVLGLNSENLPVMQVKVSEKPEK